MANFFYSKGGKQFGPVSASQLKQLAADGCLLSTDLVWREGTTDKVPAAQVRGFVFKNSVAPPVSQIGSQPPPPPPPIVNAAGLGGSRSANAIPPSLDQQGTVSFYNYLTGYFGAARGLWFWWVLLTFALAPILSLAKPFLGFRGVALLVVSIAVAGLVLGVLYLIQRILAYYAGGERSVPEDAQSWAARLSYGSVVMLPLLAILLAVEFFTPLQGLLATLVPQARNFQGRFTGDVVAQIDSDSSSTVDDGAKNSAGELTDLPDDQNLETDDTKVTPDDEPATVQPAKTKTKQANTPPELDSTDDSETEPPKRSEDIPEEESLPPVPTKPTTSTKEPPDSSDSSDLVLAEGVGSSPDETLKDAFRNAVRQVVGAVIDAETLINNDEVIDDKVLTYSDGFVKKWDEVPGSKKVNNGLHRIKIKAQIERRSVVARLKAANITTKEIDGKSLFGEAVTKVEAERDATALVKKALADLPTLLKASVVGKPEYDRDKSEAVLTVTVEPDLAAYKAFAERLDVVLKKICLSKSSVLLKGAPALSPYGTGQTVPDTYEVIEHANDLLGPTVPKQSSWCLWVCSAATGGHKSMRWNAYVLDADVIQCVAPLLMPYRNQLNNLLRCNESKTLLRLRFTDEAGNDLAEDEAELVAAEDNGRGGKRLPLLRDAKLRLLSGSGPPPGGYSAYFLGWDNVFSAMNNYNRWKSTGIPDQQKPYVINLFVAPYAFEVETPPIAEVVVKIAYQPRMLIQRRIPMTLEELQRAKDVVCSVHFEAAD